MKNKTLLVSSAVLVIAVLIWAGAATIFRPAENESVEITAQSYESKVDYESAIINAVDKVTPSVVAIIISKDVAIIERCASNLPPEFEQFFGGFDFSVPCEKGTERRDIGGGSGFIVSADGLILTNKHVVSDEQAAYTVILSNGKKHEAKVLATDKLQDLAVLKIEAANLPVVILGNSDSVRLGQTVIAIGNALSEFRNTVSMGVISGLGRNITAGGGGIASEQLEGLIQTDAAINPGNSGGPLVNLKGEVIGINTAIVSQAQNIGFALPINNAKRDIDSVRATGKIQTPSLGVRYLVITEEVMEKEGLTVDHGAILRGFEGESAIVKDSPADKAGLKAEDIILEVDGIKITEARSLLSIVQKHSVGDTLNLKILRDDKEIMISVTLEERK